MANFLLLHNKIFFSSILQKIVSHFTSSPLTASSGPIILLSIACAPNPCHQLYLEFYFSYKFLFHTKLPLNIGPYTRAGLDLVFLLSKGTFLEVTSWHLLVKGPIRSTGFSRVYSTLTRMADGRTQLGVSIRVPAHGFPSNGFSKQSDLLQGSPRLH